MSGESPYDLVVIGGGMGGLAAASLAQRLGLRTALLEAHTKLGGCAGYFGRGPFTFDAGATALMGLRPGEPVGDLLDVLEVPFSSEPTRSYRMHLPDRRLDVVTDPARFVEASIAAFPAAEGGSAAGQRRFWRLQEAVGRALFAAASTVPRLPARRLGDLVHDIRILGPWGLLAAATSALTVQDVMNLLGLGRNAPFRAMIAMLLQDTAQAGPEVVPFANAAACLHAYRSGMSRPRGGMRTLAEGIGRRFSELGGDLRTATLVDRVEAIAPRRRGRVDDEGSRPGFVVVTRRRQRLFARQVAFNLPLDLAAHLLDRPLSGRLGRSERKSRAAWSAFTGYLALDRATVPDDAPLFHQVLQSYDRPLHDGNNVLVSLSPAADEGLGPPTVRVATLSTHTRPADWEGLEAGSYREKKAEHEARMLAALARALPEAPSALLHAEFASPRSFRRYTRRTAGAVGGAPVSQSNSNFRAVGPDIFGPGLWVVGDAVFPGQGTMSTVLSAIRVVERITGISWTAIRAAPAMVRPAHVRPSGPSPGGDHRLGIVPGEGIDHDIGEGDGDHPTIAEQDAMPVNRGPRSFGAIDLIIEPMDMKFREGPPLGRGRFVDLFPEQIEKIDEMTLALEPDRRRTRRIGRRLKERMDRDVGLEREELGIVQAQVFRDILDAVIHLSGKRRQVFLVGSDRSLPLAIGTIGDGVVVVVGFLLPDIPIIMVLLGTFSKIPRRSRAIHHARRAGGSPASG